MNGYNQRLLDEHVVSIHTGYWSGYYANAKRPKSPTVMAQKLRRASEKAQSNELGAKPEVDVDAFQAKEKRLQAYRKKVSKDGQGKS